MAAQLEPHAKNSHGSSRGCRSSHYAGRYKRGIDGQIYNVADDEPITAVENMKLHGELTMKMG